MMDTIIIHFKGLEPQEVRIAPWREATVHQQGDWCILEECGFSGFLPLVKFKAKLERWERVHG